MKKSILLFALVFVSMASFAQVRVGFGLLGASPGGDFGDFYDFGVGGYLEPKYSVTEDLSVGVHLAWMAFAGGNISGSGTGSSVSLSAAKVVPVLAIGQYYFAAGKLYAGLGLGPYIVDFGSIDGSSSGGSSSSSSDTKFGFSPKVGINLGGFDLGVAYHIVSDLNFLGFNLGFHIGKR